MRETSGAISQLIGCMEISRQLRAVMLLAIGSIRRHFPVLILRRLSSFEEYLTAIDAKA
jgi:hypothetical protein